MVFNVVSKSQARYHIEICYRVSRTTMVSWEEEQKAIREACIQKTVDRLNIVNKTQILLVVVYD